MESDSLNFVEHHCCFGFLVLFVTSWWTVTRSALKHVLKRRAEGDLHFSNNLALITTVIVNAFYVRTYYGHLCNVCPRDNFFLSTTFLESSLKEKQNNLTRMDYTMKIWMWTNRKWHLANLQGWNPFINFYFIFVFTSSSLVIVN